LYAQGPVISSYSVQNGSDATNGLIRSPKSWEFQGFAAGFGGGWVTLHTVTDSAYSAVSQVKTYSFANTTSYYAYRLWITSARNGLDRVAIAEWRLFGKYPLWNVNETTVNPVNPPYGNGVVKAWANDIRGYLDTRFANKNLATAEFTPAGAFDKCTPNTSAVNGWATERTTTYNTDLSPPAMLTVELPQPIKLSSYVIASPANDAYGSGDLVTVMPSKGVRCAKRR